MEPTAPMHSRSDISQHLSSSLANLGEELIFFSRIFYTETLGVLLLSLTYLAHSASAGPPGHLRCVWVSLSLA